jgi:hypothetical protein
MEMSPGDYGLRHPEGSSAWREPQRMAADVIAVGIF